MSIMQIKESGLTFGDFVESDIFNIEKSNFIVHSQGIKSCEFVWLDNQKQKPLLWFVEAKRSVPNSQKCKEQYDDFFNEIFEKVENSVILTAMGKLGKLQQVKKDLNQSFLQLDWSQISFKLILVIPPAPKEYLPSLTDKLRSMFTRQIKLWGIPKRNIAVLNEEMAQKCGLLAD